MTIETLWHRGQIRAACDASAREVAAIPDGDHPYRDPELAKRWHDHGVLCWHAARFAEAETALGRAYAIRRRAGEDHTDTLDTLERLAALAHYQLRDDAATTRFAALIEHLVRLHGDDHVRVAVARRNHAAYLRDRVAAADARKQLDRATTVLERELPAAHPDVVAALKVDAMLHNAEGSSHAAIKIASRAVELGSAIWSAEHPFVAAAELTIATAETRLRDHKRAMKRFPVIVKNLERAYGDHPLVAIALSRQAQLELQLGYNLERTEGVARRAFEMYRRTYPEHCGALAWTLFEVIFASNHVMEAGELALEVDGVVTPRQRHAMAAKIANALVEIGDYRTALPWLERTRDACEPGEVQMKWAAAVDRWTHYLRRFDGPPG